MVTRQDIRSLVDFARPVTNRKAVKSVPVGVKPVDKNKRPVTISGKKSYENVIDPDSLVG